MTPSPSEQGDTMPNPPADSILPTMPATAGGVSFSFHLPPALQQAVSGAWPLWAGPKGRMARLWAGDATLWSGHDEKQWLGWLEAPEAEQAKLQAYDALRDKTHHEGITDVVLLGMGGSSLGPEVLGQLFEVRPADATGPWPRLHVLDTTDPATVARVGKQLDYPHTLFVYSSKSGGTLEPSVLFDCFWDEAGKALGAQKRPQHFIAVTDPGSGLEKRAHELGFSAVYLGNPGIGGRYSVLSPFGMVPASACGLNIRAILESAAAMERACRPASLPEGEMVAGPLMLGLAMGLAVTGPGRDKITIQASPALQAVGPWLEQLFAESTGKDGTGLLPFEGEEPGTPDVYSDDRFFITLRLKSEKPDQRLVALAKAGHPVVDVVLEDLSAIGGAFYGFEMATAVAGSVLGINAFDQPDVEFSKVETRKIMAAHGTSGGAESEAPFCVDGPLSFHAQGALKAHLAKRGQQPQNAAAALGALLELCGGRDYFGLLSYIDRTDTHAAWNQHVRQGVRDALKVATAAEFGPRYLHSTGQAYKGGPNTGVFLQVTADGPSMPIPGRPYELGMVENAQAQGDLDVLNARGRRALRVHVTGSLEKGLAALAQAMQAALKGN
ncbi:hypothetical protein E3E12_05860 [Formicincola oecophyllae]|uniref:Glucose-6-phosphate isomerase n=1 Tax=Formicincola oecophyllae TaxID=2558361 RepID=A0A4Y6UBF0_9PROT|nr:hypothetical protein [Formicincola oecophyllae]QDH13787.1 hypothetical protein E3E12_05860 [Formicincola oecophyllae]